MAKISFVFLLAMLAIAAHVRAEDIQLKDGTKVTGTITGVNGDAFQVKTAYGDISIPRSEIVSISFPENAPKNAEKDDALPAIDEELRGETYVNRTAGFQMAFPSGWKIAPELHKKDVVASLKSTDEILFFMATPEKFSGTLATYKVLAETQYKINLSDYVVDAQADTELDGRKGMRSIFHGTSNANHAQIKFLVYLLPYDGRMLRLSFFTLEPLFNDNLPVFEKIAASYHSIGATK